MLLCYDNEGVYVNTSGKVGRKPNSFLSLSYWFKRPFFFRVDVEERGAPVG